MGGYGASSIFPLQAVFGGNESKRTRAGQEARLDQAFRAGDNRAFRESLKTYTGSYRGLSEDNLEAYAGFYDACERAIEEVRSKNRVNCITERLGIQCPATDL